MRRATLRNSRWKLLSWRVDISPMHTVIASQCASGSVTANCYPYKRGHNAGGTFRLSTRLEANCRAMSVQEYQLGLVSVSSRAIVYRVVAGVILTITERELKPAGGSSLINGSDKFNTRQHPLSILSG
ncbi:hypothetical protein pEaSNUABM40_00118 [Erwinia phage pEa_SNUABM_40]|nr:hypothetical protein pEaSNUABM40_00118 [Erwinia phage pEa_SNUABM_40]